MDLWVGGLAEEPIPGGEIGPTFACIFAITFNNLRNGDRFWYENDIFTSEQLSEIQRTSLARILCDNGDAISTVQPNPFILGSRRSCFRSIPGIDFTLWIEDPFCYQRIRIEPYTQNIDFYFLSILSPDDVRNYPLKRPGPSQSRFEQCIPFVCPTNFRNTAIANFPSISNNDFTNFLNCRVTSNTGLPPSLAPPGSESVYQGFWNTQTVQASSGLHKDLGSCQSSSIIAMTYNCPLPGKQSASTMKSNAEIKSELAHILPTGGSRTSTRGNNTTLTFLPQIDITQDTVRIPQQVIDFINTAPRDTVSPLQN